ncbi:probable sodium/potassium-transporting ATPase subunit beta-3 [Rhopilema esculentum]|uniref:probable sodium/potassium-transporting ATPase subunit beta-3 n=1 Tax=Rhopilema esculentum TaxID=499914 RepID=UPI0031D08FF3
MSSSKGKEKLGFCGRLERQCRSFANFAYNKQTKEVMGRSGKSWAKIGLFYFAYYGFLAAFFSACLAVFLSTLNEPGKGGPKTTQFLRDDSAPGLNTVPSINFLEGYKTKHRTRNTNAIRDYLEGFAKADVNGGNCSDPSSKSPCKFDINQLGNCSTGSYGYDGNYPCVFMKINKVYGWKPSGNIKLSCDSGAKVLPTTGYLAKAFPFEGQKDYQTPAVAIQLDLSSGNKLTVKCEIRGEGFKTSDVYIAHRAFGKIEFAIVP